MSAAMSTTTPSDGITPLKTRVPQLTVNLCRSDMQSNTPQLTHEEPRRRDQFVLNADSEQCHVCLSGRTTNETSC